jgi:protein involved in polysaccharide export with SLBB domain
MMRMALICAICVGLLFLAAVSASSAHAGGRLLTASDVLAIKVVSQQDLDTKVCVAPDGTINFSYVGRIKAAGLTEDELARAVERRLVELQILAAP